MAFEVGGGLVGQSTEPVGFDAFSQRQDLMESGDPGRCPAAESIASLLMGEVATHPVS